MSHTTKKNTIPKRILLIALTLTTLLYALPSLLLNIDIGQEVQGANYAMKTGYYVGNGRRLSITGLGFSPDFIIIKSDTANTAAVFKTSAMPVKNMAYFSATVDNRDLRLNLDSDGFTVSESDQFKLDNDGFTLRNSANINIPNVRYTWIAFTGSDCESSTSTFCVGTYTGTVASTQDIDIGFQPDFVMVKRDTAVSAHYKTTAMGANNHTLFFINTAKNATGVYISSLNSDGFTVGSTDNANGGNFYYVAFKESSGFFKQGTYDGNSSDNTTISGIGFTPDWVVVKNGSTTTGHYAYSNLVESYGNSSSHFSATANLVNMIKGLDTNGFILGTDVKVNTTGETYYYLAFGGANTSNSSGTFRMAQGTYTGNGSIQSIEDIGFAPDLVIVKNNTNQIAVFRTRLMGLDSTAFFTGSTANIYGAIISLNDDSFDVGAHLTTNASGNTYQWQAFGNAYDSIDNTGSSDFAIGAIYGSGTDDRNITDLPFAPDVVVMKSITTAGATVLRTSSHSGDITSYFQATVDTANIIQSLTSDGFQIGTHASANSSTVLYFWFAFKTGSDVKVGSYTGKTPTTQTIDIDAINGFRSNLIWTIPSNNVGGITKPSTLADPASQYFLNTANDNTQITEITDNGFSVGAGTGANGVTTIRYVAWKIPYVTPATNLPSIPGTPTFSNTDATGTVISWSAASGADYYRVERATDRSGSPGLYKYVSTTSGLSISDNNLNANQKYWYRIRASNPNGFSSYSNPNSVTTTAQSLNIQTGYYIGTGDQFSISGLGFAPELVLIKSDTSTIPMIFKTSTMRDDVMGFFSATADGAVANLNLENVRYTWIAFSGSDCSEDGYFCLGTYTGTGSVQSLDTGFQPDYVTIKNNDAISAHFKTTALGSNNQTVFYINVVKNSSGAYISSLDSDGFSVGTTDSVAGGTFHYFAFREKANFFKQGTYDGNSSDNTTISGIGFTPDWVVVKNGTNGTTGNVYAFSNLVESYGNSSSYFYNTANLVDRIKGLDTDGFIVGNHVTVNATGDSYYYLAFGGASAPNASGTFRMAQGTYVGNGGKQSISGIGFAPDLVIVKDNAAQLAVFRTKLMAGNSTAYFGSTGANITEAITSLDETGFSVGGDVRVNTNGDTYQWQAFGNAYDPIENRGASDFAIGAVYGSGTDDRNITNLPFQPDMIVMKSTASGSGAALKTSLHTTDLTSYFLATVDTANIIQSIRSDGFQLGTNGAVNTSAGLYFWFAFKAGDNFKVGEYPGTGVAKDITIVAGYQPNLIWTKTNTNVGGISKPSTLADPASQYFLATANASTQITAIYDYGFRVGTGTGANANGSTVRYMAWRIPVYLISISVSDGTVSYGAIESFGSKTTLASDMPPTGDMQTVTNNSSSAVNVNIKGQNSVGSCIWTLSGTNGYNQYKHQFCNDALYDCSAPPVNYSDLSITYQRLFSNLAKDASADFQLRIVMPTSTSCFDSQDVKVTVQATEI